MIRIATTLLVAALFFAAACSKSKDPEATVQAASQKVAVSTATVTARTVPAAFAETGTFIADETSDIAPLIAGRVIATPVNAGDFVKQGQVICELDHRDAQLRLDQIRAQLEEATAGLRQTKSRIGLNGDSSFDPNKVPEAAAARANYESAMAQAKLAAADAHRYANLVATGDVSQSAYEKVKTQQETADAQVNAARQNYEAALNGARQGYGAVETSQASLEGARAQLAQAQKAVSDTMIRAPFDGYITARPVAMGEYVSLTPPTKIATIVRLKTLKLDLQTPEQRASQVHAGMVVEAHVSAYPDRLFTGKVTAVNPSVDPNSRVFILEAKFENPGGDLRPGMFATGKVLLPGGENALYVKRSAVIHDRTTDSYQVYTVNDGVARLHVVTTGDTDGDAIRIVSGLSGGETVATNHQSELYDGAPVRAGS